MAYFARKNSEITPSETAHMNLVRELGSECVVILKNDGILPLGNAGRIALYGNGARHTEKGGTGSGDVNSRVVVSVFDGLVEAGFDIVTGSWLDRFDRDLEQYTKDYLKMIHDYAEAKHIVEEMALFDNPFGVMAQPEVTDADLADGCDTAIFVIARAAGEGKDRLNERGDYYLTESEEANLKKIASFYKDTIVIINSGGIIDTAVINSISGVSAILTVSQLGNIGGNIIADCLIGKTTPSGKLTDTWAKRYEDYPGAEEFSTDPDNEFYREGIYVGYRYFDSFGIEPMYPFGYGLSYTTFEHRVTDTNLNGEEVEISVEVTNTGDKYSGKEVIQAYCSAPSGKIDKPFKVLAAYGKTGLLAPGAKEVITLKFKMSYVSSFDSRTNSNILEAGDYLIRVGSDSASTAVVAVVEVSDDITVAAYRSLFKLDHELKELTNPGKGKELHEIADSMQKSKAKHLILDKSSITTFTAEYCDERDLLEDGHKGEVLTLDDVIKGKATLEELVAQLTPAEMASLCVGAYEGAIKDDTLVGSQALMVPGAAAETTKRFVNTRKIPSLVLADGPAGLRLKPHFKVYPDGNLVPGGDVFGLSYRDFPADLPDGCSDYYQYCTAIPIASALAQTWNPDLISQLGEMVGKEMVEYNVHLWLAPGMNIHRNPLCGRNFEYYSEDPLISGKCAAAMTVGVQKNDRCGTTIKHFAANNQEDNRLFNNSIVSQKAMREIYLKGFEICVKESQPLSIMTSYNLINGTHTANNYDLIQSVLRDERGFEGVVMTDWCTTQDVAADKGFGKPGEYHESSSAECMRVGNDWIMPGCQKDVDIILDAVENGKLSVADLQFCTMNVLKTCIICS